MDARQQSFVRSMSLARFRKGSVKTEGYKVKPVSELRCDPSESGRSRRMGAGRTDHDRTCNPKNAYAHIPTLSYSSFFPNPRPLPLLQQEQYFLQQKHKNAAHTARYIPRPISGLFPDFMRILPLS